MNQFKFVNRILGIGFAIILIGVYQIEAGSKSPSDKIISTNKLASSTPSGSVDTLKAHRLYVDGDFDQAIEILETGLKTKKILSHQDSVFIFKHLGVMYAANNDTREKGKYYMHQLLMVEPTARIMDMYASDMIYMIFKNIQEEFETSRVRYDRAESHVVGNGQTPSGPEPLGTTKTPPKESGSGSSNSTLLWLGGTGIVVAAVGVAAYFALSDSPPPAGKTHNIQ